MTTSNTSTAKYWLYTFVSLLVCIAFLIFLPEWCWVTFPFFFTYLVQAFDMM